MTLRPLPFSLLAKPTGAACNLDCTYCFFLSKELLYDAAGQRMSSDVLRAYLRGYLAAQPVGDVTIAWQGGEPTMRGLAFFKQAVVLAEQLKRSGQTLHHSLQTNGTLLDDDWGEFLAQSGFLVGLSIDGPQPLHDVYRVNKARRGTHAQVIRGWEVLRRHGVETNILCTVHRANQDHPLDVYRYFRDDLGAQFLQFIPIVERATPEELPLAENGWKGDDGRRLFYRQEGGEVTSRSVSPEAFGAFLSTIWDEWITRDVGRVYVQHFDVALGNLFGRNELCVHAPTCGGALALEHNGDVYSCDHYVEPEYRLGNVLTDDLGALARTPAQRAFGAAKANLTAQCRSCPVRWACHGGCPKDRFRLSRDGEPGQNYLCAGYYRFFTHATPGLKLMADLLTSGRAASEVMSLYCRGDDGIG
ncbi:anaerobic sulfatase maturase [Tessaracoccus sp. OH4464_COT-324]|uniref:anaerobic sulfatase maturase n=1 Tax=Tessaracoccus sp. OH4464_COT-324 TaxID=2491059 RepID=UPI001F16951E|nr:anaerobic sulfatase maturase [Tessaracoccus sp. OH4464_COT-324]